MICLHRNRNSNDYGKRPGESLGSLQAKASPDVFSLCYRVQRVGLLEGGTRFRLESSFSSVTRRGGDKFGMAHSFERADASAKALRYSFCYCAE